MSGVGMEGDVIEVRDYHDFHDGTRDIFTPPTTLNSQQSSHRLVILYVIGIFLAIVILLAMSYLLKLHYKTWLPKRIHFCDFRRDCFRQSNGKKRKFFQRHSHKANFTIPVVVVSDPDGQCLDPECSETEGGTETKVDPSKTYP